MRRRTKAIAAVAVPVLAAGAAGGWALTRPGEAPAADAAAADSPPTATVTRQDLVETKDVDGVLGYGEQAKLVTAAHGTVTWLPEQGAVVTRGEPVARIDQRPVTLLYGSVPMYRTLSDGDEGADVAQLEKNLAALGYDGFTVDDEYTAATADAVEAWQDDLGIDETGTVTPAQVVFTPSAIRVAEQIAQVGGQSGAALLGYTGTRRIVTVDLDVADRSLVRAGGTVNVELPSGGTAKGTVDSIGTVAELPQQQAGAEQSDPGDATVELTVRLDDAKAGGSLDQAPVTVRLVSERRKGVLAVPVAALLALGEGGYGLQVVTGGTSRIVAVKTGMFADGRVEVSGTGIAAGTRVGVPAS